MENNNRGSRMKALLLCASHNDLGLVMSLRKLGYEIIVTGKIPDLIGQKYADRYIQMDYSDKEAVLQLARKEKPDAICQCCNDFGVYTAAYVAEKLGLPGYDSYDTTLLLHNKDRFKKFAWEHHILSPASEAFDCKEEALTYGQKAVYPLIAKPVDASAGNGISRIDCKENYNRAVENAFGCSREGRIVIEPFIEGSQHGFCTFLRNKKVVAYTSNNEYSVVNPYRVEIDTFPAENDREASKIIIAEIEKTAGILNLKDGIFHLQYIMSGGKPYIIEVMRRIPGNMYTIPAGMVTNFNWDYWETRARCGLSCDGIPDDIRQEGFYAYKTILAAENGIIDHIKIPDKYDKYTVGKCFIKSTGAEITDCCSQPAGFLFMNFRSREEMEEVLIDNYESGMVTIGKEV